MPNLPKFHVVVWVGKTDASPALRDELIGLAADEPYESTVNEDVVDSIGDSIAGIELPRPEIVNRFQGRTRRSANRPRIPSQLLICFNVSGRLPLTQAVL